MSHLVTIQMQILDIPAVAAACHRLGLPAPIVGTAKLYSSEVQGLIVMLPEWQYPVVIDTSCGQVHYDNFAGVWGDQVHLDRFLQSYAVEKTKIECRKRGHTVSEQILQDGSVKLSITGL